MAEPDKIKPSQVVLELADFASSGTYSDLNQKRIAYINSLYNLVAQLVNQLEAVEKAAEEKDVDTEDTVQDG